MLGEMEQIRILLQFCQHHDDQHVDQRRANRGKRRALHAHGRQTQIAVDEHPVQQHIGTNRGNGRIEGNAHAIGGAQQRTHRHGQDLQRIRHAHDAQIFYADCLNGGLIGIHLHDKLRRKQRKACKHRRDRHHKGQGDAIAAVDAIVVLCAVILRKKQHAAAHKSPVAREHQRRELRAQTDRADGQFAQRRQHHGIHHGARGGQKVLQRNRHRDHGNALDKLLSRKAVLSAHKHPHDIKK